MNAPVTGLYADRLPARELTVAEALANVHTTNEAFRNATTQDDADSVALNAAYDAMADLYAALERAGIDRATADALGAVL